jgi:hypothetical protein
MSSVTALFVYNQIMRRIFLSTLVLINIVVLLKILSVASFFSPSRYQPDFDAYYHLISDIRRGINPYQVDYMQTQGPPLVFLYFYPFSLFPLPTAQFLNLSINLISGYLTCLILALYLHRKHRKISVFSLLLLLLLFFWGSFLSRYSLQIGQPHLLITLLVALVITRSRFRLILLSALFSLKTFFILPLISFFSVRKSYLAMVATPVLIILITLPIVRPSSYLSYLNRLPDLKFGRITEPLQDNEYYNQSFRSTAKRLNLSSVYTPLYILLIFSSFLTTLLFPDMSLAICLSLLISPILWPHYFIILFPVFVLFFFKRKNPVSNILYLISVIMWFPDLRLQWAPVTISNRLLASHFFFSLVLLTLAQIVSLSYNSNAKAGT